MQAINHAATALILKRKFPATPLFGLMVATEAVEFLWVGLNLLGFEKTEIADPMRSVADVHLVHMPFSHSLATSVGFAVAIGLFVLWRRRMNAITIALALSLALFSHIVLDLVTHAPDIALIPFIDGQKYGTGLYSNWPLIALGVEAFWGVLCWRIYRGNWPLLGLILGLNLLSLPSYSVAIDGGESALAGNGSAFALMILGQILITIVLLWFFAKKKKIGSA
jgi:membrane-bound metal-dependent hydrolase YbcI (DUF457 family)